MTNLSYHFFLSIDSLLKLPSMKQFVATVIDVKSILSYLDYSYRSPGIPVEMAVSHLLNTFSYPITMLPTLNQLLNLPGYLCELANKNIKIGKLAANEIVCHRIQDKDKVFNYYYNLHSKLKSLSKLINAKYETDNTLVIKYPCIRQYEWLVSLILDIAKYRYVEIRINNAFRIMQYASELENFDDVVKLKEETTLTTWTWIPSANFIHKFVSAITSNLQIVETKHEGYDTIIKLYNTDYQGG